MGELRIQTAELGEGDNFEITWAEGYRKTSWTFHQDDDLVEVLRDILATVEPNYTPTNPVFLAPTLHTQKRMAQAMNPGAEAADKAAREAEMALRNGGAALAQGLGFENVPTYEDAADIPPVNWGV